MIIHNVEQGTDEWLLLRAGLATASNASKLITSTGAPSKSMAKYAVTLANDKYAGKPVDPFGGNMHTDRGTELEPQARAWYDLQRDTEAVQVGFITDDLLRYGCSPDSLIGDEGMNEIKCLKGENHTEALMYVRKHNKCPSAYIPQVQMQMLVADRAWCDSVFYHPDLPSFIIRNYPDDKIFEALRSQLIAVEAERNIILDALKSI